MHNYKLFLHQSFLENNYAYNNSVGWVVWNLVNNVYQYARENSWFPSCAKDAASQSKCTGNTYLTNPVDISDENAEYDIWLEKLTTNQISIGVKPVSEIPSPTPSRLPTSSPISS